MNESELGAARALEGKLDVRSRKLTELVKVNKFPITTEKSTQISSNIIKYHQIRYQKNLLHGETIK